MRRLVVAAALGLGLLSTGVISGSAFASPLGDYRPAQPAQFQPVHYEYGYSRFEREHHHPVTRWHHDVHHEVRRGYDYRR